MKMIFKELYLFSPHEKVAKKITFSDGVNIISSSVEDGTNRGKSIILRSLYYSLGADCKFESEWNEKEKIFILHFAIDNSDYYIYRSASWFRLFDNKRYLIDESTNRNELSKILKSITGFAVMLPKRNTDELEITPPVYNYLPYFVDQDCHDGSKFSSFKSLEQYANYKENVLYYHFGVYDESYFESERQRLSIKTEKETYEKKKGMLNMMLEDIDSQVENASYSEDISSLLRDVNHYKDEYKYITDKLNKIKTRLVEYRNALTDIKSALNELYSLEKRNRNKLNKLKKHICPECGSDLRYTIRLKSKCYNLEDDAFLLKNDLKKNICEYNSKIEDEENNYKNQLKILNEYEIKMGVNRKEVVDALKVKALCSLRDNTIYRLGDVDNKINECVKQSEIIKDKIKERGQKKKKVNDFYAQLLIAAKKKFGLVEINDDCFKKVTGCFTASGSDCDIATLMWYFAIIKTRNKFNEKAIKFPIVLDSPCNTEMDREKQEALLEYLFDNIDLSSQFIMSGIGMDERIPNGVEAHVINLTNEKYHLLSKDEFCKYKEVLEEFCNATR